MDKIQVTFDYTTFNFETVEEAVQFYNLIKKSYDLSQPSKISGFKKTLSFSMIPIIDTDNTDKENTNDK